MDKETFIIAPNQSSHNYSSYYKYIVIFGILALVAYLWFTNKCSKKTQSPNTEKNNVDNNMNKTALLRNYCASWCGATQQFLPIWDRFREELRKSRPDILTETVMCDQDGSTTCDKANIKGYPTVILYKNDGTTAQFDKSRTLLNLHEFVRLNTEPVKY